MGSSDISYYLNSHHIDYHEWCLHGKARPVRVTAHASTGVAKKKLDGVETEDTITLVVDWKNFEDGSVGHGVYTSSWVAPKASDHFDHRRHHSHPRGWPAQPGCRLQTLRVGLFLRRHLCRSSW